MLKFSFVLPHPCTLSSLSQYLQIIQCEFIRMQKHACTHNPSPPPTLSHAAHTLSLSLSLAGALSLDRSLARSLLLPSLSSSSPPPTSLWDDSKKYKYLIHSVHVDPLVADILREMEACSHHMHKHTPFTTRRSQSRSLGRWNCKGTTLAPGMRSYDPVGRVRCMSQRC